MKPKFNLDLKVPFAHNGNMLTYTYESYPYVDPAPTTADKDHWKMERLGEWRKNLPFTASLRLSEFQRGRSAAHFILKDAAGHEFTIFAKFLLDALQHNTCHNGWFHGRWAFAKRGANYSIIKL